MTEVEYEALCLHRKVDYEPWYPRNAAILEEQRIIQAVLARLCGAEFGPNCYVAKGAHIATDKLTVGANTVIAAGAIVRGYVSIGADSSVNANVHIAGLVRIGSAVRIAPGVGMYGFNHGAERLDMLIKDQPVTVAGITVGNDTWVGANAVIADGVKVGEHCIVAAGAVVTKSFEDYQVIGGNPAKVIRDRRDPR